MRASIAAVTVWRTLRESFAPPPMGVIADTLRASLREMAQADARLYRGLDEFTRTTRERIAALPADAADPADEIAAAIALLEAHGYTVTAP